ncbi:DUF58 domain-containing protein [Bacillus sp. USDA818B3_A]|uniref:DUF58 domain-containing protein n=1 Tax=Bacillus sp. USDA818B3_A TaxID=2698834 RepID=UPI00136C8AE4|nr:DUF58 domain-containing protein [Bacillus sp. USDA818B3_A]
MNIAWFIVVFLFIFLIQGFINRKWGLKGISYQRYLKQTSVSEGEKVVMVYEIMNRKLLPVPWLRLETMIHSNLLSEESVKFEEEGPVYHSTLFSLWPYQKITRKILLIGRKRGYYLLPSVSVTAGDAMGFGGVFDSFASQTALTVYPKLVPMEEIPLPSHSWLGEMTVKRWIIEDPFLHAGVREYQQGDSFNSINWKATARTHSFQINKKDYTADHHLLIYVSFDINEDVRLPMEKLDLFEKALSYAATLASYTINQGVATGFGCNGYYVEPFVNSISLVKPSVRIEPSSDGQQVEFILDAIAKVKMDRSRNFPAFLQEDINGELTNTDIIIFAYKITEKVELQIDKLEQLGNAVKVVILADEVKKAEVENAG